MRAARGGVRELGPAAVAQAVLLPLSDKPESATALVRAAAVLGDGASLAEAAGLAGLSEEEAAGAGDMLVARGILTPAELVEFAHPIVREAVYADMGPRERARAHAAGGAPAPRERRVGGARRRADRGGAAGGQPACASSCCAGSPPQR